MTFILFLQQRHVLVLAQGIPCPITSILELLRLVCFRQKLVHAMFKIVRPFEHAAGHRPTLPRIAPLEPSWPRPPLQNLSLRHVTLFLLFLLIMLHRNRRYFHGKTCTHVHGSTLAHELALLRQLIRPAPSAPRTVPAVPPTSYSDVEHCGGEPLPAPWQRPEENDGAMPAAGTLSDIGHARRRLDHGWAPRRGFPLGFSLRSPRANGATLFDQNTSTRFTVKRSNRYFHVSSTSSSDVRGSIQPIARCICPHSVV